MPDSYSLSASTNTVSIGLTDYITLTTIGVPAGTIIPYSISGILSSYLLSNSLTGNFTVNTNGIATIPLSVSNSLSLSSSVPFTLTVGNNLANISLNVNTSINPYVVNSNLSKHLDFTMMEVGALNLSFASPNVNASIQQLAATGAKSITLMWQIKTVNSVAINNSQTDLQTYGKVIDYAHSLGLSVNLRPQFFGENFSFSGSFIPTDPLTWFSSYGAVLNQYAQLAQQHGVEELQITNEAGNINTNPAYFQYWQSIISNIRSFYAGKIGVNASENQKEPLNLTFGYLLDFIGIDSYIPITNIAEPTVQQLEQGFVLNPYGYSLVSLLNEIHAKYALPVEITESAINQYLGANTEPALLTNASSLTNVDGQQMTNAYVAEIKSLIENTGSWFSLYSIWGWYSDTNPLPILNKDGFKDIFSATGSVIQSNPNAISAITALLGMNFLMSNPLLSSFQADSSSTINYIFAHPRIQYFPNQLSLAVSSFNQSSTIPSISVYVNGLLVLDNTQIKNVDNTNIFNFQAKTPNAQTLNISLPKTLDISNIQLVISGCSYTNATKYSNFHINSLVLFGQALDLSLANYSNGSFNGGSVYSNNGTITFDINALSKAGVNLNPPPLLPTAINGSGKLNILQYDINSTQSTLTNQSGQWLITAPTINLKDTLINVQRVQFYDTTLALDLNASAGQVAQLLGAVFGASSVSNPTYVGIGLNYLDTGNNLLNLAQLALNVKLGNNFSTSDEVKLLYQNLLNTQPQASDIVFWSNAVSLGQYTNASLAVMASQTSYNNANIDLIGLAQKGLAYLPVGY